MNAEINKRIFKLTFYKALPLSFLVIAVCELIRQLLSIYMGKELEPTLFLLIDGVLISIIGNHYLGPINRELREKKMRDLEKR